MNCKVPLPRDLLNGSGLVACSCKRPDQVPGRRIHEFSVLGLNAQQTRLRRLKHSLPNALLCQISMSLGKALLLHNSADKSNKKRGA